MLDDLNIQVSEPIGHDAHDLAQDAEGRNIVLGDRRTKSRRIQERSLDGPHAIEYPAHAPAPGLEIDLERAVSRLPSRARDVFVLHDVEGYRHDEIAVLLDVSSGTSKSQLHRARKLLREALR